jgi:hypothetical protein
MSSARGKSDIDGDDAWSSPVKRGEMAHARAEELRRRRAELCTGAPVTSELALVAHRRAEQAVERALRAGRAALRRHVEAKAAHLRAAAAHEQAAITASEGECDSHQSAAERHRAAAAFHDVTVTKLTSEQSRSDRSGGFLRQQ